MYYKTYKGYSPLVSILDNLLQTAAEHLTPDTHPDHEQLQSSASYPPGAPLPRHRKAAWAASRFPNWTKGVAKDPAPGVPGAPKLATWSWHRWRGRAQSWVGYGGLIFTKIYKNGALYNVGPW